MRLRHEIDLARVAPKSCDAMLKHARAERSGPTPLLLGNRCQHAARGVCSDGCEVSDIKLKLSAKRREPKRRRLGSPKGLRIWPGREIHKARPRQAHRAPIETILQAAAVHVGFKGMARVFDLPPDSLFVWGCALQWCASVQPSRHTSA
jgi:hypothetical protein